MKKHIVAAGAAVMLWTVQAFAAGSALTDRELGSVVAGTGADIVPVSDQHAQTDPNTSINGDMKAVAINENLDALNPVATSDVLVDNSVMNDNSVDALFLMNEVQKDARAVDIINAAGSNHIGTGINVLYVREPGSGSGSSFPTVNQSNVNIVK